jgi:hypothetical protein
MTINNLSTEILQRIYEHTTIQDLLHFAQTSRRHYRVYLGRKMQLLEQSMSNSYSPLPSLYKIVIAHEPDKSRKPMGTEIKKNMSLNRIIQVPNKPKYSVEMFAKMAQYGRTAERWTEIYPQFRWRFGSINRRFLEAEEQERLRGAIYHYWIYTQLFHDQAFTQYDPDPPSPTSSTDPRLRLLRTFSTIEHVHLSEFIAHILVLLELDLYPSNTIVQDHYSHPLPIRALSKLAWGDGNEHRRLIRDIMKFSPRELLHLIDNTSTKQERLDYLSAQGPHFRSTPATLNYGIAAVNMERSIERRKDPVFHSVRGRLFFPSHIPPVPNQDLQDMLIGIIDVPGAKECREFMDWYANDGSKDGSLGKLVQGYSGPLWVGADLVIEDDEDDFGAEEDDN